MSTAELELRRSLADVLDDELNRIPDHWNPSSHSNKFFEDLLILPPQEHQDFQQLSSPIFKHFTTANQHQHQHPHTHNAHHPHNNAFTAAAAAAAAAATANDHCSMPSQTIIDNNTPVIDDTHAGYVAAGDGCVASNIFSKYADPTLTTTHSNGQQQQQQQQQQQHQQLMQLFQQLQQQPGKQLPAAAAAAATANRLTPVQPTISLNSVMMMGNPFVPRLSAGCAAPAASTPIAAPPQCGAPGAAANAHQLSPSKYNLIEDHQTRIAEQQQELDLLDDEDYIRDYYMEENSHKMNYFWPLQDNIHNSQSHVHDPMQQLFDQEFDDDLSDDDDDDSNSLELLGEDYEQDYDDDDNNGAGAALAGADVAGEDDGDDGDDDGDDDDDDEGDDDDSQIFDRTRKINFNPSISSCSRPLLATDSFVDANVIVEGGDEFINDGNEDDYSSSVFDDDTLFEGKRKRKSSMVICTDRLSREPTVFETKLLVPSPPPAVLVSTAASDSVLVSVPMPAVKKNTKSSANAAAAAAEAKTEQLGTVNSSAAAATSVAGEAAMAAATTSAPATKVLATSATTLTKTTRRAAASRRKSNVTGTTPHVAKKASTPSVAAVASTPSANSSDGTSGPASAQTQGGYNHHHHHHHNASSNDVNEEHTCQLINSITKQLCLKKFSRPYDLIRHQKTIHAAKKKIFRCLICIRDHGTEGYQRTFSRGDALSRHVKVKHELVGEEAQKVIQFAKENVEYVEA